MPPGRPPKPTAVLELSGAFKKDPQRKRARANEPKPVEGPFPGFKDMQGMPQEAAFDLLVASIPPGVLTPSDWPTVMEMSRLMFLSWKDECTASERHLLMTMFGKFGMTPSDRARIQVNKNEKPKNRWSDVG